MANFEMINEEELLDVNGGNWFKDAWNATCDWCEEHKKALIIVGCTVGGIALTATCIGASVAAGVAAVHGVAAGAYLATTVGGFIGVFTGAVVARECE